MSEGTVSFLEYCAKAVRLADEAIPEMAIIIVGYLTPNGEPRAKFLTTEYSPSAIGLLEMAKHSIVTAPAPGEE